MTMTFIKRTYRITREQDRTIKRASIKKNVSESEIIRRRIPSFKHMIAALNEDMRNAKQIDITKE